MNSDAAKSTPSTESEGELFQIIDESGEGFGFDLTPSVLARPLAIGTLSLFGVGMLTGIPMGLAMGRSEETGKKIKGGTRVKPSLEGLKFAASTFGLGSLLCTSIGIAGFYAIKSYYAVDSFEQFGHIMRESVPVKYSEIESTLSPVLRKVRKSAGDTLPAPMYRLRDRFANSRLGRYIQTQVESSVTILDDDHQQVPAANADGENNPPS